MSVTKAPLRRNDSARRGRAFPGLRVISHEGSVEGVALVPAVASHANARVLKALRQEKAALDEALLATKADTKVPDKEKQRNSAVAARKRVKALSHAANTFLTLSDKSPDTPVKHFRPIAERLFAELGDKRKLSAEERIAHKAKRPDEALIVAAVGWVLCGRPGKGKVRRSTKPTIAPWVKWLDEQKWGDELGRIKGQCLGLSRPALYNLLENETFLALADGLGEKKALKALSPAGWLVLGKLMLNVIRRGQKISRK